MVPTGALDGLLLSNTYALEKTLGWRGVLVEASPSSYSGLQDNRPDQVTVNAAVCGKRQIVHYADDASICCRGIAEFMAEQFLKDWHPKLVGGNFSGLPEVRCEPLAGILDMLGIQHINFYSLDVEGGELAVLQAVDFSKISFDVLTVEADGLRPSKDQGVVDLLRLNGYRFHAHVERNDWFVRDGFEVSSARAPAL